MNEEFGYDQDKIAIMMSRSRSHISNTLRLLNLPKDIIAMLEQGELTAGQARPLIGMPNASSIAEEIVAKNLSARSVELLVRSKKGLQKTYSPVIVVRYSSSISGIPSRTGTINVRLIGSKPRTTLSAMSHLSPMGLKSKKKPVVPA